MTKSSPNTDSLELLLDTICNMFGGIVFISILVVLMLQTGGEALIEPEEPLSEREMRQLQNDVELSRIELDRLQSAREHQLELLRRHVSSEMTEELDELESLHEEHSDLENQSQDLREDNAERLAEVNEANRQARETKDKRDEVARRRDQLQQEVEERLQESEVSFPKAVAESSTMGLQVVMRYGRLYFKHDPAALLEGRRIVNTEDYVVLGEGGDYVTVTAKVTGGLDIRDEAGFKRSLTRRLQKFPSSRWHFSIAVWPDSFAEFRSVREALTAAGYTYETIIIEQGVNDRGGKRRPVQR